MARRTRKTRKRRPAVQRSSRNWINKWTLGGAALVVVGLLGFVIATSQPSPGTTGAPSTANQQNIPFPEVPRTPLAEAKSKYDAGTALFVDTRSVEEFERNHIPDAMLLPLTDLTTQNPDLPRDAEIITYCT